MKAPVALWTKNFFIGMLYFHSAEQYNTKDKQESPFKKKRSFSQFLGKLNLQ